MAREVSAVKIFVEDFGGALAEYYPPTPPWRARPDSRRGRRGT
jgi:hypothetical protein